MPSRPPVAGVAQPGALAAGLDKGTEAPIESRMPPRPGPEGMP
jgi:hypothetical protein